MSIDNSKELKYNYYNNLAVHSKSDNGMHYSFKGKENEPNVFLFDKGDLKKFVSNSLHILSNDENNGELIIENMPITNFDKNLVVHFPLISDSSSKPNDIDKIMKTLNSNIEINKLLPQNTDCAYSEKDDKIHVTFVNPIKIRSGFTNKDAFSIKEGFDIFGPDGKKIDDIQIAGEQWMECDNVPLDSEEVLEISLPMKQHIDRSLENFSIAYYFMLFVILLMGMYFAIPVFYKTLYQVVPGGDLASKISTIKYVEMGIAILFLLTAISLVTASLTMKEKNKQEERVNLATAGMYFLIITISFLIIAFFKKQFQVLSLIPDDDGIPKDEDQLKMLFSYSN